MGSSIVTFNTLQLFCKCFTIPLHNNSHKHAPTFLNPVTKCSNSHFTAVFSAHSCNSAAQTLDFSNDDDNPSEIVLNDGKSRKNGKRLNLVGNNEKGSGISDIEALNFSKNDDNSSEMVVYDGKSRDNGKRFNLGVRNVKGNNVGAVEAPEFRKYDDNSSENRKNGKRLNFGVRNGKSNGVSDGETINFRNDDESSSGVSFFHSRNGIVEGKDSDGVDDSKSKKYGERFNFERRSVKGNGISGRHGSAERKNSKRSDLVERNEKDSGGSSLGDKRVGFDRGRNWEKSSWDSGWSREHGDRNYGKSGGRIHVGKRSEMGNGILSSKVSGGGGMGGVERSLGSVDLDNDNKGKSGYGVSNRRPIDDKVASGVVSGKALRRMERILECVALVDESKGEKGSRVSSTRPKDAKTSSVDDGNVHDNDSEVKRKRKKKLSKKDKDESPQFQLRIGLDMCCKKGDVMGAISLYDSAVKQGVKMEQYQYTVLLYLCSSAATGVVRPSKSGSGTRSLNNDTEEDGDDDADDMDDEGLEVKDKNEKLEMNEIRVSDDVKKYALERGLEVYERMCSDKVEMNEAALTSVARMAMAMGNGDMAFDMVIQMKSMGINPRLRSYGPALSVFSSKGELEKAFAVENHMLENGVYPEEPELEALLRVSIQCGKADKVYYVLHKLRTSVRSVSPSTAEQQHQQQHQ